MSPAHAAPENWRALYNEGGWMGSANATQGDTNVTLTLGQELEAALNEALADPAGQQAVRSLRRDPHDRDESCWLHRDGWCLSKRTLH